MIRGSSEKSYRKQIKTPDGAVSKTDISGLIRFQNRTKLFIFWVNCCIVLQNEAY